MKKLICIILTAVLLLLCACNVVTPPAESGKDSESDTPATPEITPSESSDASPESSEPKETESEKQQTSETPPPISSSEEPESSEPKESKPSSGSSSGSGGDQAPVMHANSYEEYLDVIEKNADILHDNFVTFDMLGENFVYEYFVTYDFPGWYLYTCIDESGAIIDVWIELEEHVRKPTKPVKELSESDLYSTDDLRFTIQTSKYSLFHYTYILNEDTKIIYKYFYDGQLANIYWNWRDQIISIHPNDLENYPVGEKDTFYSRLLSLKTAKDTVLEFNLRLEKAMANK